MKKIKIDFYEFLHETDKAYLFEDFKGEVHWLPKSITDILSTKKGKCSVCVASFKYTELTGITPQKLTESIFQEQTPEILGLTSEFKHDIDFGYREPLPHQEEGVKFCLSLKSSYLWMEQGTGKTKVYITVGANLLKNNLVSNIIIVCPVNIKEQWKEEIIKDYPNIDISKVHIFGIETHSHDTAFEKIKNYISDIDIKNSIVILDEAHNIRHIDKKKTQRIIELFYPAKYKICGSGTPIGKNAGDLYSQFYLLDNKITGYDTYTSFANAHLLYGGRDGEEVVGYKEIEIFAKRISPYIFKRTKEQVLNLPDKEIIIHLYEPSPDIKEQNEKLTDDYFKANKEGLRNLALQAITKMQTLLSKDKNRDLAFLDLIKKIPENEKVIIWYKYDDELDKIKELLKENFSVLHGKISKKRKEEEKEKFKNENRFLIVNQSVGGTGLNLQFCKNSIYFSMNFSHIDCVQSEDRTHRIGQEVSPVYYRIIAKGSIDERIQKVLSSKKEISEFIKEKVD